jgi:hypothetical protein
MYFCDVEYPLNIICNVGWKVAIGFVILFILWWIFYPKPKIK